VSPEKIVASAGAGTPFIDTDPVELIEPIDCGACVRAAAAGGRASEETAHSADHVKSRTCKEIVQNRFEQLLYRGSISDPVQNAIDSARTASLKRFSTRADECPSANLSMLDLSIRDIAFLGWVAENCRGSAAS
jgi:hypothetical protein